MPSVFISRDETKRHVVDNALPPVEGTVQYPKEWFEEDENEGRKPPIRIYSSKIVGLKTIRTWVYNAIMESNLTSHLATTYLYMVLKAEARKNTLIKDWSSFNRVIGTAGSRITIQDLFERKSPGEDLTAVSDGVGDPKEPDTNDKWMCLYICCVYRFLIANHEAYIDSIRDKVTVLLNSYGAPEAVDFEQTRTHFKAWERDSDYVALLAIIDMYYSVFKHDEFAFLRMGTIVTKYRDCVSLIDLLMVCSSFGMEPEDLAKWIWTNKIAGDLNRLTQPGNEVDVDHSYTQYFSALGLSTKSPYSIGDSYQLAKIDPY